MLYKYRALLELEWGRVYRIVVKLGIKPSIRR